MSEIEMAVIGGSGLYQMDGLEDVEEISLTTPFGKPSDKILVGSIFETRLAFLPRHGRSHFLTPSEVPYAANIFALKQLGVRYVISVSACGSLREELEPGHIIVPDQLVDFTKGKRERTFFGRGLVAHIGVSSPFSPEFSEVLANAVRSENGIVHEGGSFITIEGPRFSTKGESNLFRQWGMSIVGMTTSPEAFLAAEAELAYACMAHVTDYDVWHDTEEPVTVEMVTRIMSANTELAQRVIKRLVSTRKDWARTFAAHNGLKGALALIGDWGQIDDDVKRDLMPIIGKYLSG